MKRMAGTLSILSVPALACAALAGGALSGPLVFVWGMSAQVFRLAIGL
jgi:hypothetical protein